MSAGILLGNYLSKEKQTEILSDLVEKDRFKDVYDVLCSVSFHKDVLNDISVTLAEKVNRKIRVGLVDEDLEIDNRRDQEDFAKVVSKLDDAFSIVQEWTYQKLLEYSKRNIQNFYNEAVLSEGLSTQKNFQDVDEVSKLNIILLLDFLELIFSFREGSNIQHTKLDMLLITFHDFADEGVALASSRLIRWKIPEISKMSRCEEQFDRFIWRYAKTLFDEKNTTWKLRNGFLFLMRSLMTGIVSKSLFEFMKTEEYWALLQFGLAHEIHEFRKLSLSNLKLTLQNMPSGDSFTNSFITWSESSKEKTIEFFKKFTTLYEIVGLDTALNQMEAAHQDIVQLFEDILMPPSWGLIIISTGLKAPMESVRRYTVKLMFDINDKSVFQYKPTELRDNYLPSCMNAQYFNVVGQQCSHGEALSEFVEGVLTIQKNAKFNLPREKSTSSTLYAILDSLLQQKKAFDPARIYVAFGIFNALKKNKLHILNESHLRLMKKLFGFESEEEVFETSLVTIYLKLLMHIDMNTSVISWIDAIAQQIKTKSGDYKYVCPLIDDYIDVAITYFDRISAEKTLREFQTFDSTFQVLTYLLFDILPDSLDNAFLLELGRSGGEFGKSWKPTLHIPAVIAAVLRGRRCKLRKLLRAYKVPVFNSQTWEAVNLNLLFSSLKKHFNADKFKFFVHIYKKTVQHSLKLLDLNFSELINLYHQIDEHVLANIGASFKYKDSIYGDYFTFFKAFSQSHVLIRDRNPEIDEVSVLLKLMNTNVTKDNGNFLGNLAVIKLCEYLLNTYVVANLQSTDNAVGNDKIIVNLITQILCEIWDSVSCERLILHQKELHLNFIKVLFHPMVMFFALEINDEIPGLGGVLLKYGRDIIKQAHSRRTLLPTLGKSIDFFMQNYGDNVKGTNVAYEWLISLLIETFTQCQTDASNFKLKPVIGNLFDKRLNVFLDPPGNLYDIIYEGPEIAARVYIIGAILNSTQEFKEKFMEYLMETDTNFLKAMKPTDGAEELQRLLKWQLLLLTIKSVSSIVLNDYVERKIYPSILRETSPAVRIYMEWSISHDIVQYGDDLTSTKIEDALFELLEDHSKPILTITSERILYIATKALNRQGRGNRLLNRFLPDLILSCSSNKPLIRHFSNSLILSFWPSLQKYIQNDIVCQVLEKLFINAQKTQVYGQYRSGDAKVWDLYDDLNLTNIFGGVVLKISDHNVRYINEDAFKKFLSSRELLPIGKDEVDLWLSKRSDKKEAVVNTSQMNSPLQTKSGAWETVMEFEKKNPNDAVKRSELIVVASLVDKAPNLGGICRLCDVLGVGLLTVHDTRVKNDPQFKSVAVTADRWMPIEAVAVDEIINYMRFKKREGYTLVGLEQTDKSVKLDNSYKFPTKTLILLGTEAEGIPGYLLSELDLCLEIKQSGVIRSMNIQTATAVIVHAYSAQHM